MKTTIYTTAFKNAEIEKMSVNKIKFDEKTFKLFNTLKENGIAAFLVANAKNNDLVGYEETLRIVKEIPKNSKMILNISFDHFMNNDRSINDIDNFYALHKHHVVAFSCDELKFDTFDINRKEPIEIDFENQFDYVVKVIQLARKHGIPAIISFPISDSLVNTRIRNLAKAIQGVAYEADTRTELTGIPNVNDNYNAFNLLKAKLQESIKKGDKIIYRNLSNLLGEFNFDPMKKLISLGFNFAFDVNAFTNLANAKFFLDIIPKNRVLIEGNIFYSENAIEILAVLLKKTPNDIVKMVDENITRIFEVNVDEFTY